MNATIASALAAAVLMSAPAGSQEVRTVEDWRGRIADETLAQGAMHLGLFFNGERDGFMRFGWSVEGDELTIWDRSLWSSAEVYESYHGEIALADFAPREVAVTLYQQAGILTVDAAFQPGRATGEMAIEHPDRAPSSQAVDAELPDGAVLRATLFLIAATTPLELGEQVALSWYASLGGAVAEVTLSAVEEVEVETPAGLFRTRRLELRGGSPNNDIFVDIQTGRIVRIDVVGVDMRFLALPAAE
jgi:hypothetical protein